ncbi:MerR family transcriptional regulator [Pseudonocardia lacus]|jgi:DNA-binding transcriptional MerR regulator|uniref:MerR family transcriptional regulator n=1 Tax=Pseudonocardia lacus TaxID=2835865 RepID=UPI002028BEB6|nr:helix-turn-helix domain-containing protein [Pseudonocardia lacus]
MERYLTTGELSRRLGVAPRTIQDWRRRKWVTPAFVTAGGQARWIEEDVREQLRKREEDRQGD